jgi:hypothetical protein
MFRFDGEQDRSQGTIGLLSLTFLPGVSSSFWKLGLICICMRLSLEDLGRVRTCTTLRGAWAKVHESSHGMGEMKRPPAR